MLMSSTTSPEAGELTLRLWNANDTKTLLGWLRQDPSMLEDIGFTEPVAMVEFITEALLSDNARILAAVETDGEDEELVGYLAAVGAMPDGSAQCHIGTAPDHRGRGEELMEVGLATAFGELGLSNLIVASPKTRRGRAIQRWQRQFGFHPAAVNIQYQTRDEWEARNGNGDRSSTS